MRKCAFVIEVYEDGRADYCRITGRQLELFRPDQVFSRWSEKMPAEDVLSEIDVDILEQFEEDGAR